ncbi:Gfo/Idh/MocA family protein [Crocinitomix catalasitica]|uniref:Gfo/Idh/MocA family protein n=1 Tax=Crocinitomix catalasitica TaxID=184607 RepID=UPI000564EC0E|nr:Gfo/Idh/MocA family oxidoreductase [Crocinitomix catalasitica]
MIKRLIEITKNKRKQRFLRSGYTEKYAFIGIGQHSINNLYPILNYLRLDLKYIVTKGSKNANLVNAHFRGVIGTNNLSIVLSDPEIKGVFISTVPSAHFELIKKVLEAGKAVFVEKPPCANLVELKQLIEIENKTNQFCLIGLQKQYAPSYQSLKNKKLKNVSYNYRYVTGDYPEGDLLTEIFIHPLSLIIFLFGDIKQSNIKVVKTQKSATTIFLHLEHNDGNVGSIELSTNYSWEYPTEKLIVNMKNEICEINNTEALISYEKKGTILNIPKEKIFKSSQIISRINHRNNFIPTLENNQLYNSGYYAQIKCFAEILENKKGVNHSSLKSCVELYEIIKEIRRTLE